MTLSAHQLTEALVQRRHAVRCSLLLPFLPPLCELPAQSLPQGLLWSQASSLITGL